jgi:uroporphyrinogen decarboxylase
MAFQPDYTHFLDVMHNRRPARLPIYEHLINVGVMEEVLGLPLARLAGGDRADLDAFFGHYCRFFRELTYDVVSFEVCITAILPDGGAIMGGRPGPIQNRADFECYPWDELEERYWAHAAPRFEALRRALPPGMAAVGGVGNGVFEISEDLVGLTYLPYMQVDDPELYADLFARIGELMVAIWARFLDRYADAFVACRFGDDLGFRSSLLTNPRTVHAHIMPQYRRVITQVHRAGKPFLWHSCGCVFDIMEEAIAAGIDAKHSNEDAIAPFERWIELYGERIALLGGFDMDFLCRKSADEVFDTVFRLGQEYRRMARGYALGSGNSIPEYVPLDNYLAMIRAAQAIREQEGIV